MTTAKDRLRLWLRLLKVTRGIEARLREALRREFKTTLPRFDMMAALSRHPEGLKMSALSGVLRVSNGNVTGIVDRLEEEGLAVRVPVPRDRRAMMVRMTEDGLAEFARQAQAHEGWIDEMLGDFTADEARSLATRLMRLAETQDKEEMTHAL
ncbi:MULTISPECIES: MarR family winged helix-turn-helix transcriptional regulator [Roseobacteraceae]|jgi:DNA-binding MarR family transcriptional regulator|uniref:Transcriptional activatory protein BadR n=1 Tax=Pseudosulfitobacter pseudonitzschiae TaxID=1402135 RepID=A0A221JYN1_9RHOB|nr:MULTISPECIES: MarR family transcriptional regulator [Roseobacteraceae]ASM71763.1 transcriptional activatory protein BadR [Pseudosulfitobacter pseudonitzschiae]